MSMSALFILDSKGKVLIFRNYRGDVEMNVIERFMQLLVENDEEHDLTPIVQYGDIAFIYIKHTNVYLVAVTKANTNVALVLSFLHKIVHVFTEYFNELEEESVRDNFVIIYELLDEFMDFGYPQSTECKLLQEYITQEVHQLGAGSTSKVTIPPAITNAVSWRGENVRYRKNEVFLDVIESVNTIISSTGNVVSSEISGLFNMRVYLSGRPDLRIGLNVSFEKRNKDGAAGAGASVEKEANYGGKHRTIELDDIKFHQCVRLSRFENERQISFIPPDGEFVLMTYRVNTGQHKAPFIVETVRERYSHSRVEYMVKAKSQFKRRFTANNVEILVPVPNDVDGAKFKTSCGHCKYVPEKNCIVWSVRSFVGEREHLMRAHFNLPSVESEDHTEDKAPIQVRFEIPYYIPSGILVRYLKIIEASGYEAIPWIRYITQNGNYQIRTNFK